MEQECTYCSLPLSRRAVSATIGGERRSFCCYGCVLALQITGSHGEEGAATAVLIRLGLAVFFAMNVMMLSLPTYAPYVYGPEAQPDGPLFRLLDVVALGLTVPVLLLLGGPILVAAGRALRQGWITTDSLVVLGAAAAFGLSVAHTLRGDGPVYFDTVAVLLVVVTVGRYLEARSRAGVGAIFAGPLVGPSAAVVRVGGDGSERVTPGDLVEGDIVRILPGDAFPTDGVVLEGHGGVDEASLTGESRPVPKDAGAAVAGGTHSVDGVFLVRVTRTVAHSTAARIAAALATARRRRARLELTADRVTRWFVPAVVAIAALSAVVWISRGDVDRGVLAALSVLVVACPCALGIATPLAMWTGLLTAAGRGVVVRNGVAFEGLARSGCVLFDKTGTLTTSEPRLCAIEVAPAAQLTEAETLARAVALEADSRHPFARALRAAWAGRPQRGDLPAAEDVRLLPGEGMEGRIDGRRTTIGSMERAARRFGAGCLQGTMSADASTVALWDDGGLLGVLHFREQARDSAAAAVAALRRDGLQVGVLTGDSRAAALVPDIFSAAEVECGLLPSEKVRRIETRKSAPMQPSRRACIAMVGDGLNDAPALGAADVGIAVGQAADLTRGAADVILLAEDLERIPWAVRYARRVESVIRQNLAWAFGYNALAVAAAAAGLLNPVVASLAMVVSNATVVASSRRLKRPGPDAAAAPAEERSEATPWVPRLRRPPLRRASDPPSSPFPPRL